MVQDSLPTSASSAVPRLYNEIYDDLVLFLVSRIGDRDQSMDLAQEAFLRLLRIERKELINQPKAYLYRIAINLVYEFRMREKKSALLDPEAGENIDEWAEASDFVREVETRDAVRNLKTILDKLPPLYAAILLMRKRDGMSHPEIATELGVSVHTVHKYLTRALVECRKASLTGI